MTIDAKIEKAERHIEVKVTCHPITLWTLQRVIDLSNVFYWIGDQLHKLVMWIADEQ